MNIFPLLFVLEWENLGFDRSFDRFDAVGCSGDVCVEKSYHVVAGLAIGEHWLVGDVLIEAQWKRSFVCQRELSENGCYASFRALSLKLGGPWQLRVGHSTIGVARWLK